jgi:hypothetical protein
MGPPVLISESWYKSVNGIVPFTDLSLRSFYLLARPRTPEAVRNKVLSKAPTGPMKHGV